MLDTTRCAGCDAFTSNETWPFCHRCRAAMPRSRCPDSYRCHHGCVVASECYRSAQGMVASSTEEVE